MKRKESYVVIAGCGRLGAHLAAMMSAAGSSVVVIDRVAEAFEALPPEFSGFTVEGDASEATVLRRAKTDRADLFVAATGSDTLNLMAAQVAGLILGAKRSLACVDDPERIVAFEGSGIDVVSPTAVVAGLLVTL